MSDLRGLIHNYRPILYHVQSQKLRSARNFSLRWNSHGPLENYNEGFRPTPDKQDKSVAHHVPATVPSMSLSVSCVLLSFTFYVAKYEWRISLSSLARLYMQCLACIAVNFLHIIVWEHVTDWHSSAISSESSVFDSERLFHVHWFRRASGYSLCLDNLSRE